MSLLQVIFKKPMKTCFRMLHKFFSQFKVEWSSEQAEHVTKRVFANPILFSCSLIFFANAKFDGTLLCIKIICLKVPSCFLNQGSINAVKKKNKKKSVNVWTIVISIWNLPKVQQFTTHHSTTPVLFIFQYVWGSFHHWSWSLCFVYSGL